MRVGEAPDAQTVGGVELTQQELAAGVTDAVQLQKAGGWEQSLWGEEGEGTRGAGTEKQDVRTGGTEWGGDRSDLGGKGTAGGRRPGRGIGRGERGGRTCTLPSPTTISAVYANCTSWSKA